jgi:hypothetical protein
MGVRRIWAVYTFSQDYPVLVERCVTRVGAVRIAELRSRLEGTDYAVVEQLLPDRPLVRPSERPAQSFPGAG